MTAPPPIDASHTTAAEAIALVEEWLSRADGARVGPAAARLAGVIKDPQGLSFAVGFIDGVIRPDDLHVAARNLRLIAPQAPAFLPWHLRAAVRAGGAAAAILPGIVVPIARRALRRLVGHLVIDATPARLGRSLERLRREGDRVNLNLLGEAVLGDREADRRLDRTRELLERDDVDYVSIKVSSIVAPHSPWAFEETVGDVVARLAPLYETAMRAVPHKFVNLDMEEYKDLDLTLAVFTRLLDRPELSALSAGIVLQAYLPDAYGAMGALQDWAARRTAAGGAPIKVRVVKGANLPMERVDAELHGWPLATVASKQDADTSYKRILDWALQPARIANVRIGAAGHNLFDLAFAYLTAKQRGVLDGLDIEMLLGMAPGQAAAVRDTAGAPLLYTPLVHPREFDVAISYLIRRLEEGASEENFMSAAFDLSSDRRLFEREARRFADSHAALDEPAPGVSRRQDRRTEPNSSAEEFANTPDTDPSISANRDWASEVLAASRESSRGSETADDALLHTEEDLDLTVRRALDASATWGRRTGAQRAETLRAAAKGLAHARAELLEAMASEAGKTIDQGDPEVSEAIDFANYYAHSAELLDQIDGASFEPSKVIVVTPPWNFPVSIPAGSVLAALAAGSSVILKPARLAKRCAAVIVEALWNAGVPRDVLQLALFSDPKLGGVLIADPRVDRVVLTGGYETAELFRSLRPDLRLLAETSGKNAIVVAPSADLDLAAKDVLSSAFGHAGQKCSAASLVILVGSVARSGRFIRQLEDAVQSLRVGFPHSVATQMGPIIAPAEGKLLDGLTRLAPGERWLVEPRKLDGSGVLWSPGVKLGVARGSESHLTEYFGPILSVMTARTLEEAVDIQNQVDYGLTAGLHSLDPDDIAFWIERVQAGNLYVNRGTTGAIVQRQPFGGWKRSTVGNGAKAGGPNYLMALGSWRRSVSAHAPQMPAAPVLRRIVEAASTEKDFLRRSLASDLAAWEREFSRTHDASGLAAERNVLRYRAVPVHIRIAESTTDAEGLRVIAAGVLAGGPLSVSSTRDLAWLEEHGVAVERQSEARWRQTLEARSGRIRLVGGDAAALAGLVGTRLDVTLFDGDVTESGRIELLPFLQEQAISITAHRFGNPAPVAQLAV